MGHLLRDLRFTLRLLRRRPGFTALALGTLALGIGGNSAIFSVVDGVLLRSLPYPDAGRLVSVWQYRLERSEDETVLSWQSFLGLVERSRAFSAVAAALDDSVTLTGGSEPVRLYAARVSGRFFDVFQVSPLLGRGFRPDEVRPGAPAPVAVLGEGLWRRRFGSDPDILGRVITLDGQGHTVVGVMPESLRMPVDGVDVWLPDVLGLSALTPPLIERGVRFLAVFGRLADGVDLAAAGADLDLVAAGLEKEYPERNQGLGFVVRPLREQLVGAVRPALWILLAAIGLVLVVACANVAALQITRLGERRREIGIRTALGGAGRRILAQLVTEGVVLAALGGALGIVLGGLGLRLLTAHAPSGMPRVDEIALNYRMVVFTAGLSLLCGVAINLVPAWHSRRLDVASTLAEGGGRGHTAGTARQRARQALVVLEVALALVVLVGAGLLIRTFSKLRSVDPGFDSENRLAMTLTLPEHRYPTDESKGAMAEELLQRIGALPGVEAVAIVNHRALAPDDDVVPLDLQGRAPLAPGELTLAYFRSVSTGYFDTLGIALRRGRTFGETDRRGSPGVAIVNQTFARQIFPGEDPIGRRFAIRGLDAEPREVVGVVEDVVIDSLREKTPAVLYTPFDQLPRTSFSLVVRSPPRIEGLSESLRKAIREMEPEQPVYDVATLEQVLYDTVSQERFYALAMAVFSALAACLASVGIYGVVAFASSRRSSEVGVRMALGASRSDIVRLVAGEALVTTALGLALGVGGAWALTRYLASLLFEVRATDPPTILSLCLALGGLGLLAALLPAWRAARADPARVLHEE